MATKKYLKKGYKIMYEGSNCDRKSQLSEILTEPFNPREGQGEQAERDKGSRRGGVYKSAGRKGRRGGALIVSVTFIAPRYKDLSLIG